MTTRSEITPIDVSLFEQAGLYNEAISKAEGLPAITQPQFFSQSVRSLSTQSLAMVREILCRRIPELSDPGSSFAIVSTGSDGRLEKTSLGSPVELVVIAADRALSPEASVTKEKIVQLVRGEGAQLFFREVEEKFLATDRVSVFSNEGRKSISIPTRVLDAQFLTGNLNLFVAYKDKLKGEFLENPKLIKAFREDFLKPAIKTLEAEIKTASSSPVRGGSPKRIIKPLGVDAQFGRLRSDGEYLKGPKYGLLRSIQYVVALLVFNKAAQLSERELREIPPTVPERIDWLRQKNGIDLTEEECTQLKGCYSQGIFWYGQLQREAEAKKASKENIVTISVDAALLRATLQRTQELVMQLIPPKRLLSFQGGGSPKKPKS